MQLDDLDFADDLAHLSHNHSQMQHKTTLLETTSAGTGLKINRKKTELMKMKNKLPTHQSQLVDSPSGRRSLLSTWETWLTNREARPET